MPKRRRVPEVLWRLFRDRARTMADTIVSLLPSPATSGGECRCKGRRCINCCGGDVMAFLLRSDDPSDYRKLMSQCFVVVSDNAPTLSHFSHVSRWSLHQIVVRTVEMIISVQQTASNVICSGFDKREQSSPIIKLLTCLAWDILLKRVGDDIMIYLLKHTSIFLPLPQKKHHQVSGFPISNLCLKLPNQLVESQYQSGKERKRGRVDMINSIAEAQQPSGSLGVNRPLNYVGCFGSNANEERKKQEKSNEVGKTLQKRSRPFSWQRQRKRRRLNPAVNSNITIAMPSGRDSISGLSPYELRASSCCSQQFSCTCSSSSILQAPRKFAKGVQISRKSMFFNSESSPSVLPRKHVLNSLKPNYAGSDFLMKHIFGTSGVKMSARSMSVCHSSGFWTFGSTYQYVTRLLKILIRRTRRCQYTRLLDKHCASPSTDQFTTRNSSAMFEENELEKEVLEETQSFDIRMRKKPLESINHRFAAVNYCSKDQVVSFIWAVCRSIVPQDLLGTPCNWRILRKNISKYIQLRRFEKFSLKQAMHKLKMSGFPFLSKEHSLCCVKDKVPNSVVDNQMGKEVDMLKECSKLNDTKCMMKRNLLESWIFWFFSYLVTPLLQANFYVTETENGKQDIYFYRKSLWEKLTKRAITSFKEHSYCYLSDASARNMLLNRAFGFSKLRLRPKENGLRILANLKASSRMPGEMYNMEGQSGGMQREKNVKFAHYKPVNYVLRDTHAVMKGIQLKEPELLGSSVFDYNDVYRKISPFLMGLKKGRAAMPDLFLVVSDVSNAFDSVNQDKLLTVMKNVFANDEYHLKQSHQVFCTKKSLWAHENVILTDPNISSRFISSPNFRSLHSVLVNQEWSRSLTKKVLFLNLNEHVKRNVLQLDKKFYLQGIGIPQGSVLSSLLCSLYYGDLDRNVIFPFLERTCEIADEGSSGMYNCEYASMEQNIIEHDIISSPCYLLLRFIDDFLFISTSKKQAAHFFSRLQRGFRDYNCYMNERKYGLNFNVGPSSISSSRVCVGKDSASFLRWSGLLINCHTFEVQADYTKYLNNHLSSTLTVCWQGKPGQHLKTKLCDYVRPKCHPIFFDSNINSAAVVRLNIFQAFLLCAMKFHCYLCQLSYICKLSKKYCLNIIRRSLRYMDLLIKKRMHFIHLESHPHPSPHLEEGEVEWLGLNAFIQVLKRKQSRHTKLLSLLRSNLLGHRMAGHISSHLTYAVDSSHSSVLWKIKY